jgi:hypothetical protein
VRLRVSFDVRADEISNCGKRVRTRDRIYLDQESSRTNINTVITPAMNPMIIIGFVMGRFSGGCPVMNISSDLSC